VCAHKNLFDIFPVQSGFRLVGDSASIAWVSVDNILSSKVYMLIFVFFYLESCIWPDAILHWIRQRNSKCASNFWKFHKKYYGDHDNNYTSVLGKKEWAMHRCFNGEVKTHWDRWTAKLKVSSSSLTSRGSGRLNSQLHILLRDFMAAAWKCMKTLLETLTKKEQTLHRNSALPHTSFFTRQFFTTSNITVISYPPYVPHLALSYPGWL
jgi:hypothetical protein